MLNFRYANIEDKEWISPMFKNSGYLGADFCFGSLFIWQEIYKSKISKDDDFLYRIYDDDETLYEEICLIIYITAKILFFYKGKNIIVKEIIYLSLKKCIIGITMI